MNSVLLTGNLGANADLRDVNGFLIARLNLATTARYRDREGAIREQTDWHRVTAFQGLAKSCRVLQTGDRICVQGRLRTTTYEKDGEKRTYVEVIATAIEFLRVRHRKAAEEAEPEETLATDDMDGADEIPF